MDNIAVCKPSPCERLKGVTKNLPEVNGCVCVNDMIKLDFYSKWRKGMPAHDALEHVEAPLEEAEKKELA